MRTMSIVLAGLLGAAVLTTAGCGRKNSESADGKITITFWHSCVSSTVPALNELIAKFEEEHPGIDARMMIRSLHPG